LCGGSERHVNKLQGGRSRSSLSNRLVRKVKMKKFNLDVHGFVVHKIAYMQY